MTNSAARVLVVGAGIAGLTLARALDQRRIACVVAERREAQATSGMALNLPGNAVRALAAVGAADRVASLGLPVERRDYLDQRGKLLFSVDERAFWAGVAPSVCVRRQHVVAALQPSPEAMTSVRYGLTVTAVHAIGEHVEVEHAGSSERTAFDLVVGADGVHSAVRPAVSPATPRPSAMTSASWRFVTANPGVDCWTAWSGPAGTFLLIPVDAGQVYGYASGTSGDGAGPDPAWLQRTFSGFPTLVARTVSALVDGGQLLHSPVEEVTCDRWSRDRVVLIGDAAHATGPVWAQGAAMAMEDALTLAELLAATDDWSSVGSLFETRRRPRVDGVRAATERMSRLAALPSGIRALLAPRLGPRAYRTAYRPLRLLP